MNKDLTEIAFILDRSGSMSSHLNSAIEGFNGFLREQKDTPGQARFSLILFDDHYEVTCASVPVCEVVDSTRARSCRADRLLCLMPSGARSTNSARGWLRCRRITGQAK
jgi:hypothetical protein